VEFYASKEYIEERTDDDPILLGVGAGVLILLCTLLFLLYDVPMRKVKFLETFFFYVYML
jgi:hypothetical protein